MSHWIMKKIKILYNLSSKCIFILNDNEVQVVSFCISTANSKKLVLAFVYLNIYTYFYLFMIKKIIKVPNKPTPHTPNLNAGNTEIVKTAMTMQNSDHQNSMSEVLLERAGWGWPPLLADRPLTLLL